MMNDHHQLTDDQIAIFQREARKTLVSTGYNLFAEITLRLIEHYYARLAEIENAQNLRSDRDIEGEFLARENDVLRIQIAELEQERDTLREQIGAQRKEIEQLKRKKLNLPPSWK